MDARGICATGMHLWPTLLHHRKKLSLNTFFAAGIGDGPRDPAGPQAGAAALPNTGTFSASSLSAAAPSVGRPT